MLECLNSCLLGKSTAVKDHRLELGMAHIVIVIIMFVS
jgi:hypothetical protein